MTWEIMTMINCEKVEYTNIYTFWNAFYFQEQSSNIEHKAKINRIIIGAKTLLRCTKAKLPDLVATLAAA